MNNNETKKHLQEMADKLARVMAGETSDNEAEIVGDILISLANESGFGVDDPRIIKYSFPAMMESVSVDYSRGVFHSLKAVVENETVKQDIPKVQAQNSPAAVILNWFPAAPEQAGELERLAAQISEVMKHPLLPPKLYEVLSDELTENPFDTDSPEWILANLKKQNGE